MRVEIPILFVVAISLAFSYQYAAACPECGVCLSVQSGSWTDPDVWNCELTGPGNGPPPVGGEGFVNDGHTVTFDEDVNMDPGTGNGGVKTNPGGIIVVEKGVTVQTGFLRNDEGTFEINGDLIVTNVFDNRGLFNINCMGSVVIDPTSSSSSSNSATLNNHGSFELKENVFNFQNNGDFNSGGTLINVVPGENFDGNAISPIPSICIVGGESLSIETTSLILAGAQTFSWMIPVVLSVLGIGLFVVSRKSENS